MCLCWRSLLRQEEKGDQEDVREDTGVHAASCLRSNLRLWQKDQSPVGRFSLWAHFQEAPLKPTNFLPTGLNNATERLPSSSSGAFCQVIIAAEQKKTFGIGSLWQFHRPLSSWAVWHSEEFLQRHFDAEKTETSHLASGISRERRRDLHERGDRCSGSWFASLTAGRFLMLRSFRGEIFYIHHFTC